MGLCEGFFSRLLVEGYSDPKLSAPNDVAGKPQPFFRHDQCEIVGHPDNIRYFKRGPGSGEVADWLKGFVTEVPIEWIPAGDPFWVLS